MHSFGDVSPNISQRSELEIFYIEDEILSNFRPFIFYIRIRFTQNNLHDAIKWGSTSFLLNTIDNYGKMGQT